MKPSMPRAKKVRVAAATTTTTTTSSSTTRISPAAVIPHTRTVKTRPIFVLIEKVDALVKWLTTILDEEDIQPPGWASLVNMNDTLQELQPLLKPLSNELQFNLLYGAITTQGPMAATGCSAALDTMEVSDMRKQLENSKRLIERLLEDRPTVLSNGQTATELERLFNNIKYANVFRKKFGEELLTTAQAERYNMARNLDLLKQWIAEARSREEATNTRTQHSPPTEAEDSQGLVESPPE